MMTILGLIVDKSPVDIAERLSIRLSHERGKACAQIIITSNMETNHHDIFFLKRYATIILILPERRM